MNITSRQLKAFLLTARHQSFSRAAERLFITQSGMSVLIRELEEQLGFRLFDRTTRRVTLTQFGTQFLPIADHSLLELEAAAANIGRSAAKAGDFFTIGATPLLAAEILPAAIAAYASLNADLRIRLHDAKGSELLEMVRSGAIDVALAAFGKAPPGVQGVALVRFSMMLVQPAGQARPGSAACWADIIDKRLVGRAPGSALQQLADQHLQRAGRRTPPEVVCNYLETQIAMVEAGAGVAVLPSLAASACVKRAVTMHPLVSPLVSANLNWAVARGRTLAPGARNFKAFLKDYIADRSAPPSRSSSARTDAAAV